MVTIIYTETKIYKTYRLNREDTQTLQNEIKKLKQLNPQFIVWDEQIVMQKALNDLLEEDKISPIKIDEDGWGEEITSVNIYKR